MPSSKRLQSSDDEEAAMDWQGRWDRLGRPSVWVGTAIVALVVAGAVVGLSHQPSRSPTSRSATTSALNTGGGAASSGSSPGTVRSSVAATTESRHLMSGATGGGGAAGTAGDAASAQPSASAPSPAAAPPPTGSAASAVPAGLDQPRVVRTAEL